MAALPAHHQACVLSTNPGNIIWKYTIWHGGQTYAKSTNSQYVLLNDIFHRQDQKVGYIVVVALVLGSISRLRQSLFLTDLSTVDPLINNKSCSYC